MYSIEHKKYLKDIKNFKISVIITQVLIFLAFIIIWQILADKKLINTFIFSSPLSVLETIVNLYQKNDLISHIWVTTYETLISFSLGTIIGLVIASILWWNKFIAKVIDPYLTVINSLPKVALGPIIIIWVGASIKSIILMALLISVIITIITAYNDFNKVDKNRINLMKSFKATKSQIFFKLILPHSMKSIVEILKINISMSFIGVIMGEFLVSKSGIGYLIVYGSQVFNLSLVISGIFLLAILATLMYAVINFIGKKLIGKNN